MLDDAPTLVGCRCIKEEQGPEKVERDKRWSHKAKDEPSMAVQPTNNSPRAEVPTRT